MLLESVDQKSVSDVTNFVFEEKLTIITYSFFLNDITLSSLK